MAVNKLCAYPGCFAVIPYNQNYCIKHRHDKPVYKYASKHERAEYEPREVEFYASRAWRHLSKSYRYAHPVCEECLKHGIVTPGRLVDHIKPIRTPKGWQHRLDDNNLQTLCYPCHALKTSKEVAARGGRQKHRHNDK